MSSKLTPLCASIKAEIERYKNLPSYPLKFGKDSVIINGVECPIHYHKHGRGYYVDLVAYGRTVKCKDGMAIIEVRDMIEKAMS